MRAVLALAVALTLTANASAAERPKSGEIPSLAAATMREDAIRQLVPLLPPATTRLYIEPRADELGLAAALRGAGYAVAGEAGPDAAPGYILTSTAVAAGNNLFALSLRVGTITLARGYVGDAGAVEPAGAWSVDASRAPLDVRERVVMLQDDPDAFAPPELPFVVHADPGSPAWAARLRQRPPQQPSTAATPAAVQVAPSSPPRTEELPPPLPPRLARPPAPAPAPAITKVGREPARVVDPAPGPWRVQLGAYAVPSDAPVYARDLIRRHAQVIGRARPYFVQADSREPRTIVQVGPYASRADAVSVCLTLRSAQADCIVVEARNNG